MGRKSFAELCAKDLSLSATRASELMDIVALVPRDARDRARSRASRRRLGDPARAAAADARGHAIEALTRQGGADSRRVAHRSAQLHRGCAARSGEDLEACKQVGAAGTIHDLRRARPRGACAGAAAQGGISQREGRGACDETWSAFERTHFECRDRTLGRRRSCSRKGAHVSGALFVVCVVVPALVLFAAVTASGPFSRTIGSILVSRCSNAAAPAPLDIAPQASCSTRAVERVQVSA